MNERLFTHFYFLFAPTQQRPQKGLIALTRDDTFNFNPMLLQNISKSPYFLKCCSNIHDWTSLVDEIYYECKHMEPWTQVRIFS